ncbi:hypothetical protein Thewi_2439 [Thermoanaerobacter wiegelii Rt8.B1]|uniref:Uncharacterized protein n=1 Tax=Thermoanaerobacter wiegelii Rt8.B1 TaxID=697303 RepID=G2MRP3_9THEO|nr:hypothetical protein Thewi_2439 [Thermoanaerobacter wiegelii Rt8.B1]
MFDYQIKYAEYVKAELLGQNHEKKKENHEYY